MTRQCDSCDGAEYTKDDPFVHACQQRPSDPSDMCCVMWGHWHCLGGKGPYVPHLPTISGGDTKGALATPDDIEKWIESPDARAFGYTFIT